MLEEMSSELFVEWMAFHSLEPWGYEQENWRAGSISATVANVNRTRNTRAFVPADFMPQRKKQQTEAEMLAALKSFG